MNLEELAQEVKVSLSVPSEERLKTYQALVAMAREEFPDFAQAVDQHHKELRYSLYELSGEYVRPQKSGATATFQRFFASAQGFAMMYSLVTRTWYAQERTNAARGWQYHDEGLPVWVHPRDTSPKGVL